jgi:hypothetical protein
MRFCVCVSISLGLAVAVSPANAATMYTMTYTATTGVAPVNGSFTYNSDTDSIANFSLLCFSLLWFSLLWPIIPSSGFHSTPSGLLYEFNLNGNPEPAGLCDVGAPGGTPFDFFSFLSDPTWGSGDAFSGWSIETRFGVLFYTWGRWNIAETDLMRLRFVDPSINNEFYPDSAGTFTITAVEVPEPSTFALFFSALAVLYFAPSRLKRATLFRPAVRQAMRASALE